MTAAGHAGDLEVLRTLAVAAGLSALIGLERGLAHKPAGLRTQMLVGVAAALFMQLGGVMIEHFAQPPDHPFASADPTRILQAIVVGVSFLGAGTIMQGEGHVEGLTTAASLLLSAGIGIAVALERTLLAGALAVATPLALFGLGRLERWIGLGPPAPQPPPAAHDPTARGADSQLPARRRRLPAGST